jgi:hypothetical protein
MVLKLHQQRKASKAWDFDSAWHGIDKASKDIAGDLARILLLHSGYLWRGITRKTMQKLAKI